MQVLVPGGGWEMWRPELAALNLLALALLVPVVFAWAADARRRRFACSAVASALAIACVYLSWVGPQDIPTDWITILHEGQGYKHILELYVRATHAGANFPFIVSLVAGPHPTLRDVVWLNLLLALINAAIFLHIAVYVAGPWWGVMWTLVFALNPATFLSAFSELPTQLLALYFQAGLIGWVVLVEPRRRPVLGRAAAFGLCAVVTVLSGLVRPEVALIGIVALGLFIFHALLGDQRWAAAERRLLQACEPALAFLAAHPAVVAVLAMLAWWFTQAGLPGIGRTWLGGLYPFNPALFSIFFYLPTLLLPVGVSVAVFFGFVHAVVRLLEFGGLPLSLFILIRTYFAAENQYYEAGRYLSYVFPALFVLGLFGKQQFDAMTAAWRPNWARLARVLYVMAWFTRALPGIADFYLRPEYHRQDGFAQVLLDRNSQREVRHLVRVTEENPTCVFVGRVVENYGRRDEPREYAYAFFGVPVPAPIFVSERSATLGEAIARFAPGASCVRLYLGGDCNLTDTDGCTAFIAGRRLLESERFWSRPYNNPPDYGYAAGDVVLGVYAWP